MSTSLSSKLWSHSVIVYMGKSSKTTSKKREPSPPPKELPKKKPAPEDLPEDPEFATRPGLYGYRGAISSYIKTKLGDAEKVREEAGRSTSEQEKDREEGEREKEVLG